MSSQLKEKGKSLSALLDNSDSEDDFNVEDLAADNKPDKDSDDKDNRKDEVQLKQVQKKQMKKLLTEDVLMGKDGVTAMYNNFPGKFKPVEGNEKNNIKQLMDMYRGWAFELHPGMSSADVMLRCESLGGSIRLKNFLNTLRSTERDRYLDSIFPDRKVSQE